MITENHPLARLRHHVSGAIARGEAEPIINIRPAKLPLTKAMAAILTHLNGQPDKAASHEAARKAAKLTLPGYYRVRRSMMDRHLIAWSEDCRGIQMTFGGICAIREAV